MLSSTPGSTHLVPGALPPSVDNWPGRSGCPLGGRATPLRTSGLTGRPPPAACSAQQPAQQPAAPAQRELGAPGRAGADSQGQSLGGLLRTAPLDAQGAAPRLSTAASLSAWKAPSRTALRSVARCRVGVAFPEHRLKRATALPSSQSLTLTARIALSLCVALSTAGPVHLSVRPSVPHCTGRVSEMRRRRAHSDARSFLKPPHSQTLGRGSVLPRFFFFLLRILIGCSEIWNL